MLHWRFRNLAAAANLMHTRGQEHMLGQFNEFTTVGKEFPLDANEQRWNKQLATAKL